MTRLLLAGLVGALVGAVLGWLGRLYVMEMWGKA